ncbi:hypothetical protein [Desertibacillus haloalkaliphilus]|uniref:hypothetical protein n=1 Tax=Desertibacillus haloalkaliphilus TaxID=1328930 RepID=UPI001C26DC6B|nr:hypothetical protein [Desertibacillus haloalkaliphilus]MBU8908070.1 hypothetical protein [Desertibacillus haloalkaliphilus]
MYRYFGIGNNGLKKMKVMIGMDKINKKTAKKFKKALKAAKKESGVRLVGIKSEG